ncbi:peptide deformylase [Methylobacterium sp. Leaf399]|uniref:peptide deformylase n=1 Tax=Methylobacterium sp. Leaf399 TaxID=1736364 RepID=UPI0006F5B073|nr:peptide deformylase [Methylobacterium sp. Leaf399]KQT17169.1 peptide deformylase [Methylobacterium sp. Leaf399]
MTDPDLVLYPDPRLGRVAAPVCVFDEALRERVEALVGTLRRVAAIGLAGPHIGLSERLVVLRMEPGEDVRIYVNPVVAWASDERAVFEEGSVSMPGIREEVERPAAIRLAYRAVDGTAHEEEADGFRAACLQHEIDQLDGIFWIERLSRLRRDRARKRFAKLRRPEP